MNIEESKKINNLKIIRPKSFFDFRGEFIETYSTNKYDFIDEKGQQIIFVEDNISISNQNVLRGIHGDNKTWKLIQCLYGEVYFAVVDMRNESLTYLNWEAFSINEKNRIQILIPAGCANGYLCLSDKCIFSYKQSQLYSGGQMQFTIRWDDPKLNINWPVKHPLLSERDQNAKFLT